MSLKNSLGTKPNIFSSPMENKNFRLETEQPILTNEEIQIIRNIHSYSNENLNTGSYKPCFLG